MNRSRFLQFAALLWSPGLIPAAMSAREKLKAIENNTVAKGETVRFTRQELLDYAREELRQGKVAGLRNPSFTFGSNQATGTALVDFHKLQEGVQGHPPGILSRLLLSGERTVEVSVRLSSQRGWCRVDLLSVEIDGWDISGRALDWMIANYVNPRYPKAKINEWFQLEDNVRHVNLTPSELTVLIA